MPKNQWFDVQVMKEVHNDVIKRMRLSRDVVITECKRQAKRFRKTGNLETSFGSRFITRNRLRIFNNADYAPHLEFGTRPHIIEPKKKQVLAFQMPVACEIASGRSLYRNRKTGKLNKSKGKNTVIFAKRVKHPGTVAQPFMRPGYRKALPKLRKLWGR